MYYVTGLVHWLCLWITVLHSYAELISPFPVTTTHLQRTLPFNHRAFQISKLRPRFKLIVKFIVVFCLLLNVSRFTILGFNTISSLLEFVICF